MKSGGLVAINRLAALANTSDEASIAMRWLDMPTPSNDGTSGVPSAFTLKVIEDPANIFVRQIKVPLNIISVMGPARSGKSTLMNLLAGCKTSELFTTSPGMETFTKGVYIPTRLLSLDQFSSLEGESVINAADPNIKISFVDTEGQGAVGTSYDMNLFSPALVASRVVIYNRTGGLLTEEILSQLGMMTQAALRLRKADPSSETTGKVFGHLCILFNQFRLGGKDTADTLKQKLLNEEPDTGPVSQNRNKIRQHLQQNFESIQVFILPDNLKPEAREALNDGTKPFLLLDDFGPKYQEFFKVLRTGLAQSLVSPREMMKGTPLTGGAMADFMPKFADAINRAEPLNLPSIFEAAQNDAINKALAAFDTALGHDIAEFVQQEPQSTSRLGLLFDQEVKLLLAALASTISYMPADTVKQSQASAEKSSEKLKAALLDTNLSRLQALMSTNLNSEVAAINNEIFTVFPVGDMISQSEIDRRISNLQASHIAAFKAKGEALDSRSLPANYQDVIANALKIQKDAMYSQVASVWLAWVSGKTLTAIEAFSQNLIELANNTASGDDAAYNTGEATAVSTATTNFNKLIDSEYLWPDKPTPKQQFKSAIEETRGIRRGLRDQNEATIKTSLKRLVKRLQDGYSNQLAESLIPNSEPDTYETLTNSSVQKGTLQKFCTSNKLKDDLADDVLLDFDTFVSSQKNSYRPVYTKACDDYRSYLLGEINRQVPLLTSAYLEKLDAIALDINSSATSKAAVAARCDAEIAMTNAAFTVMKAGLHARDNGAVSKSIVDTYNDQLSKDLAAGKKSKLGKYDEVVSAYNKSLLSSIIVPIIDKALGNKFASTADLATEVANKKVEYDSKSCGDKAEGGDADLKWKGFLKKEYPILEENVKAFNGFTVSGLDAQSAGTREVQEWVVKNIYDKCANLAGTLNMSYINSSLFDPNQIQDLGMVTKDGQVQPETTRTFRLVNLMKDPGAGNNFDWEKKTNLEFFGWEFEMSDIIFGKPIITDLKPLKIDTSEFPLSTKDQSVQVGTKSTETSTITQTHVVGVNLGGTYSATAGVKDVASTTVSATFNVKYDYTNTTTTTSTFETSTTATITLPANRTNVVNQMVFSQRTSLPYTAKIRFIPKLRFQGGFTAWGGGSYQDFPNHPNAGALKPKFKSGDRNYQDFEFPRTDTIRDLARTNADPWDWETWKRYSPWATAALLDPLADPKTYEVYVKGKWEGITGKYAVTTVTPKETNLTLLPE